MFTLEKSEIVALIEGRFQRRACVECHGMGFVWVRGDGVIMSVQELVDECCYKDLCEHCNTLGFHIIYDEE